MTPSQSGHVRRLILTSLIPVGAFILQWLFWDFFQPLVWVLFYPAVFFCAWLTGLWGGLAVTAASTVAVWWFFIPTSLSFDLAHPGAIFRIGVFVAMGTLFSLFQERLRKAKLQAESALAAVKVANDQLEERIRGRTVDLEHTFNALQVSEERLKLFVEHAPAALAMFDRDMRYLFASTRWLEDYGLSDINLVDKSHYEVFPDIPAAWKRAHQRGMAGEVVRVDEDCLVRTDGSEQWLRWEVWPWRDARDAVGGIIIFSEDITERRQTLNALETSENRFRTLLNAIPDLIWMKDVEGVYLACNTTFERFFGAGQDDIIGKTDYDFVSRELADFFREHDRIAMAAGKPSDNEEWITFADDGHRALLLTTKVPLYAASGENIGVLGIGRDITALRKAEQERTQLETQLHQAKKIESLGQLAGGVAHDFNNMLGVILGHVELANKKLASSQPIQINLEEIFKAAEHSAELTRQLLTFARKQVIDPKILDLNEKVSAMLKMLERLIGENVELAWHPAEDLWTTKVDPTQLNQILTNLCINARDAIPGSGRITINTENCHIDEDYCATRLYVVSGDYVRLSVSDNGCGLDQEALEHIFDPFYTTKSFGKGTGLGLATVFGAVRQNRGFIDILSEPGQGTTFLVYLPKAEKKPELSLKGPFAAQPRGAETILLVEDDLMVLQMTASMLEICGYTVLTADTPEKALSLVKDYPNKIQLLVTDVVMPLMNGKELSDKLLESHPDLKVLFMTGYSSEIISNQGILQDGVNFMQKPFALESLSRKVREVLDSKDTAPASIPAP